MVWHIKRTYYRAFFFGNGNVTGSTYRNMLIYYAFPQFARLRSDHIFQQDGASPHFATQVRAYQVRRRPNNWIGRGGPVSWPPRSPDLTPCDFFLWGHIKSKVYDTPLTSAEELKTRIRAAVRSIRPETLRKVWENTKLRLNYVSNVGGGHIENRLN